MVQQILDFDSKPGADDTFQTYTYYLCSEIADLLPS